jgi:hypothetical protein
MVKSIQQIVATFVHKLTDNTMAKRKMTEKQ